MQNEVFTFQSRIAVPAEELFRWHERPGALQRLTPPWQRVELVSHEGIQDGNRAVLRAQLGPAWATWIAEHRGYAPPHRFQDVQVEGPFDFWQHTHTIQPDGLRACFLEDRIEYRLPLGALGQLGDAFARRSLERMFAYRHRVTAADVLAHQRWKDLGTMKVLISGSTGLIGSALTGFLRTGGHEIVGLTRREPPGEQMIHWDPAAGRLDADQLRGFDAVVHLAGENVASRWTDAQKAKIRDSRVKGTQLLCERLASLPEPPRVLVCASAIGYYGDRGDEPLTEESLPGKGFLADVCQEWEAATDIARTSGIRVVNLRIGVVLTPEGGALAKMLTPFKLGAGGRVSSGRQYWSWVARDDVVGAIHHCLMQESLSGPVNATAPNPVRNSEFTQTLGRVLDRPTLVPLPAAAARLMLGEAADEMLLYSAKVLPKRLLETGYSFRHPELQGALRHMLGR